MQFYLCINETQYELCRQFQQRIEGIQVELGFPTVYGADSLGNLLGFTSTNTEFGCVISGPTVIDPYFKPRLKYAQEQIKAYESSLRSFGVTEYLFSVDKINTRMLQTVERAGLVPYDEDETSYWYKKSTGE